MKKRLLYFSGSVISALVLNLSVAQGQTPSVQSNNSRNAPTNKSEFRLVDLVAQAGPQKRSLFSLMPSSSAVSVTGPSFSVMSTPAGPNLTVLGSGTIGRLAKWTGITSSNSFIGDSTIFEDKFGKVGIGTDTPTSRFTVAGLIETTSGGVKFPDGTVQTTAGIASTDVVRSLNGLKGDLLLAGGANIAVTSAGNTITIAAPNVLTKVTHDTTLTGEGTVASPLSVVPAEALIEPVARNAFFIINQCGFGRCTGSATIFTVPTGKLLVIEHVSATCELPVGAERLNQLGIGAALSDGTFTNHQLIPVFVNDSVGQQTSVSRFNATQPMRLYAHGALAPVGVFAERDGITPAGQCEFHISGHLVTLP